MAHTLVPLDAVTRPLLRRFAWGVRRLRQWEGPNIAQPGLHHGRHRPAVQTGRPSGSAPAALQAHQQATDATCPALLRLRPQTRVSERQGAARLTGATPDKVLDWLYAAWRAPSLTDPSRYRLPAAPRCATL